jgi:hypothetical protein
LDIDQFIRKWRGIKGGAERANYQLFLTEFAQALDLPTALPGEGGVLGDYQFDGPVAGGAIAGGTGFADLYKKGSFILEAKQSKLPEAQKNQPELFDVAASAPASPSGARYDRVMRDALAQAKRYAVNLPANHPWPPFLIVCDVGRAFELYFDWSGNGRGYGKQSFCMASPEGSPKEWRRAIFGAASEQLCRSSMDGFARMSRTPLRYQTRLLRSSTARCRRLRLNTPGLWNCVFLMRFSKAPQRAIRNRPHARQSPR